MEQSFTYPAMSKGERYAAFLEDYLLLIDGETDTVSLLANTSAALHEAFNYFWKRWYDKDKELSSAFQYLQIMPFELQKEVSLEIIEKLEQV